MTACKIIAMQKFSNTTKPPDNSLASSRSSQFEHIYMSSITIPIIVVTGILSNLSSRLSVPKLYIRL